MNTFHPITPTLASRADAGSSADGAESGTKRGATSLDAEVYLEPSAEAVDGGQRIGRRPRAITKSDLLALRGLGTPTSPLRALRARCMHCCGFEKEEVRKCVDFACPSWPFRMGHNPFIKGAVTGPEVDAKRREDSRVRRARGRTAKATAETRPA